MSIPYRPPAKLVPVLSFPPCMSLSIVGVAEVAESAIYSFTAVLRYMGRPIVVVMGHTADDAKYKAWRDWQRWQHAHPDECDPLRN